jgi:hypothetical protein
LQRVAYGLTGAAVFLLKFDGLRRNQVPSM